MVRIRDVGHSDLGALTYSGFSRLNGRPSANVIVLPRGPAPTPRPPPRRSTPTWSRPRRTFRRAWSTWFHTIPPYSCAPAIEDVMLTLFESHRPGAPGSLRVPPELARYPDSPAHGAGCGGGHVRALSPTGISPSTSPACSDWCLAIGIVVDDSIVVVEAVQRHIDEGMPPREATIQALSEVSAPVVAIAFILAAVFIPVAFLGGISGQIYKQFALTIAVSVLLSAFSALSLSPALERPPPASETEQAQSPGLCFRPLQRGFGYTTGKYLSSVKFSERRARGLGCAGHPDAGGGATLPDAARRVPAG